MRPRGVHSHRFSIVEAVSSPTLRSRVVLLVCVVLLAGACSSEPPEVPLGPDGEADEELAVGRQVWGANCSNCHGSDGGGGTGPRLAGRVAEEFPDIADQVDVIRNGRSGMPSFHGRLSEREVEAVARYTREVLE